MNRQPYSKPPHWWSPKLSRWWIRFWRRVRLREQVVKHRLVEVEVRGLEQVQKAVDQGNGVLITPNHCSHADAFALYGAADALGMPFYVMVAWQVFARSNWFRQLAIRQHGCFSVDREGTDVNAIRQARDILMSGTCPLVIFPEGEVYHVNDRVMLFREGPAGIALMAAKKATRPVVCIPCAIKYRYLEDPTPELTRLMAQLEQALFWRPRPDLTLPQRIYHLAEGMLALKEIEVLGATQAGRLPKRIRSLIEFVLCRIEGRYGLDPRDAAIPERVKSVRRTAIDRLGDLPPDDPARDQFLEDLDDVLLVVQGFSYPGNYVAEQPSIERIAETLDKFEEDVLGASTATVRGTRQVVVTFDEPIVIDPARDKKEATVFLTKLLEQRVQTLLDKTE
ncbi:MAG: lysophospholipid acyltransferase family protein [Thermoguttaceae bacterium]